VLSNARLDCRTPNRIRNLRSRTFQQIAPDLAASVISRTSAIRIATSRSGILGPVGMFFMEVRATDQSAKDRLED
jgi:hypothetical protein